MRSDVVEVISCDRCRLYDAADRFPDSVGDRERYLAVMERFGHKECGEQDLGAGLVCPSCGNHWDFDFDPDCKMLERKVA